MKLKSYTFEISSDLLVQDFIILASEDKLYQTVFRICSRRRLVRNWLWAHGCVTSRMNRTDLGSFWRRKRREGGV